MGEVAVALLPVVCLGMLPGGISRFVLPKLTVAAFVVLLAALARPAGGLPRDVGRVVTLGAVWLVVAALLGASPTAQLAGRWPRYEGLVALPVYAGCLWAGARLLGPEASERRRTVLRWAVASVAGVAAMIGLAEAVGLRPVGGDAARPGGLMGNASQEGLVGAMLVGLLLPAAARRRDPVAATGLAAGAMLVVVSGSRGALGAALLASAFVAVRARRGRRVSRLVPVGVGVGLAAAALGTTQFRDRLSGSDELAASTVGGRWQLWGETLRILAARPVAGAGPSGFFDEFAVSASDAWRLEFGTANPPDSPHLVLLQAGVAGGLVLVALAPLLAWRWARATRHACSTAVTAAVDSRLDLVEGATAATIAGAAGLLVGFTHAAATPLMVALAGAAVAVSPRATSARAWHVVSLASLWVVGLVLACVGELVMGGATSLAAHGEASEASSRFALAQRLRPWDPDIALLASQTFAAGTNAGDAASAQAALVWTDAALARTPASVDARRIRAIALGVGGQPSEGLGLVTPLLDADRQNVDLLLAAGTLAAQSGDGQGALDFFDRATRADPANELAWQDLEIVAGALGDQDALARVAAHRGQ